MKLQYKKGKYLSFVLIIVIIFASLSAYLPVFVRESNLSPNLSYSGYREAPSQWADFNFSPYGAGVLAGDILNDNGVDTKIISGGYMVTSGESYKGYIKPNADILTQWNNADGPPHCSKIDEAKEDMNGDGGNIRENVVGQCDKWHFTSLTLAPNEYVTKLVYWAYIKEQASTTSTYVDIDTSASTSGSWTPIGTSYLWKSYTKSGLWLSQSELDGFWLQAKVADIPSWMEGYNPGWIDINTVYVDVYVKSQDPYYKHDWTVLWDATDFSIEALHYDFRTQLAVTTTIQIWNYDTNNWDSTPVVTHSGTSWVDGIFEMNEDFISTNDEIKLRFSTNSITNPFDLYLDQLFLTNVGAISILSPTDGAGFTEPMEGYYPATYGFEEEEDGTSRLDIDFIDSVSAYGTCRIQGSYSDLNNVLHKKLLHIDDYLVGQQAKFIHNFDSSEGLGVISFWFLMTDKYQEENDKLRIYTTNDVDSIILRLTMEDGQIYDSQGNYATMTYNKWYHVIIYFDSLSSNAFYDWYLNDELQYSNVPCEKNMSYTSKLAFSGPSSTRGEAYFDAFGFSWDPAYTNGLNRKEGIFVDIDYFNVGDLWYSIDDGEHIDVRGDFVIPFPFTRDHTIKVGGMSDGFPLESDPTAFSFDFGEKIAIMIWLDEMNGTHIHEYKNILKAEGFTKFYCNKNLDPGEYADIFDAVDSYEDEDDIIFLYLHGHGMRWFDDTIIQLDPFWNLPPFYYPASGFRSKMNALESNRKMVLAHCCHAGGFVNYFDIEPYTVISSCKINELSYHYPWGEGIFNEPFFNAIEYGSDVHEAFSIAAADVYDNGMTPQISDLCDITFFGY